MDDRIEDIAATAGDNAVANYGTHLPKSKQLELWRRYRDAAYASLLSYRLLTARGPVEFSDN